MFILTSKLADSTTREFFSINDEVTEEAQGGWRCEEDSQLKNGIPISRELDDRQPENAIKKN